MALGRDFTTVESAARWQPLSNFFAGLLAYIKECNSIDCLNMVFKIGTNISQSFLSPDFFGNHLLAEPSDFNK